MAQRKRSRRKRSSAPQQRKRLSKNTAKPFQKSLRGDAPAPNTFLTRTLPLLLLVLITFIAYVNAFPDNLVWDDARFAVSERYSHLGLADIGQFFTEDLWAVEARHSGLYRPLLLLSMTLDVRLLGDWAAGYHLVNILLHVLVTLLVYGLVRHLLLARGGQPIVSHVAALLAAVIFGVHPIHTEIVNSVFNRSELLVSVGVVGGLWWFLKHFEQTPKRAWFGLCLVYLLILFCRENAVVLPALAVSMLVFTLPGNWLQRLGKCMPVLFLLIPLGVYLFMRGAALAPASPPDSQHAAAMQVIESRQLSPETPQAAADAVEPAPNPIENDASQPGTRDLQSNRLRTIASEIKSFSLERIPWIIRVWAGSLKIYLWPHPLQLYRTAADVPGLWPALLAQLALLGAALAAYLTKRRGMMIGLSFFYLAILPSSGLFSVVTQIEMTERFLYLPSVGLAIVLAFILCWLSQRVNLRAAILPIVILTVILTPLTWARNADWASDLSLAESDYRNGVINKIIVRSMITQYLDTKNYRRAAEICDLHPADWQRSKTAPNLCAQAYDLTGRFSDAEQALLMFVNEAKATSLMHVTLGGLYLRHGRKKDAQEQFELGIAAEKQPAHKELLSGFMLTQLYPRDRAKLLEARAHIKKALEIQPQLFQAREMLNQLDQNPNLRTK